MDGDQRSVEDPGAAVRDAAAVCRHGRERAELTVRQKILVAAMGLCGNDSNGTFGAEDLIVRVWKMFPESFSLRGFERLYPDSNRVLAKLAGESGLCGQGWLKNAGQRRFSVTRSGRAMARRLLALPLTANVEEGAEVASGPPVAEDVGPEAASPTRESRPAVRHQAPEPDGDGPDSSEDGLSEGSQPSPMLSRVLLGGASGNRPASGRAVVRTATASKAARPKRLELARAVTDSPTMLTSQEVAHLQVIYKQAALSKFLRGQPLNFADACGFWGFGPRSQAATVNERLGLTTTLLKRAVESYSAGDYDPRLPPLSTCYGLYNLNQLLREKFANELEGLGAVPNNKRVEPAALS